MTTVLLSVTFSASQSAWFSISTALRHSLLQFYHHRWFWVPLLFDPQFE